MMKIKGDYQVYDENKGDACLRCPFRIDSTTCQLPIGKKGKPKSPQEHYRQYFGRPCHRTSRPDPNKDERRQTNGGKMPEGRDSKHRQTRLIN